MALERVTQDKHAAEEVATLARDILRVLEVQDKKLPTVGTRPAGGESK